MSSDELSDILQSFAAIQAELRKIPAKVLGCRLLHWDPQLEKENRAVYFPLNTFVGGKPGVTCGKVRRTKYLKSGQRMGPGTPERQFALPYMAWRDKAGLLVASAKEHLASVLPEETLATKNDLHRWVFTVYDIAWRNPPETAAMRLLPRTGSMMVDSTMVNADSKNPLDTSLSAFKYIPVIGMDAGMRTDESVLYDLEHVRSISSEKRFPPGGHRAHLAGPYASWSEQLPVYYGSRLDDVVRASDWAIDWLVKYLAGARGPVESGEASPS